MVPSNFPHDICSSRDIHRTSLLESSPLGGASISISHWHRNQSRLYIRTRSFLSSDADKASCFLWPRFPALPPRAPFLHAGRELSRLEGADSLWWWVSTGTGSIHGATQLWQLDLAWVSKRGGGRAGQGFSFSKKGNGLSTNELL